MFIQGQCDMSLVVKLSGVSYIDWKKHCRPKKKVLLQDFSKEDKKARRPLANKRPYLDFNMAVSKFVNVFAS